MARWSNGITICINLIALLLGLTLLGFAAFFATHKHLTCLSLLFTPCLRIGILLVVVSLLGLLGSCCRSSFLLWLYLFFNLVLILVVTMGVVLWAVVMSKGAVRLDVGEPHKLNDFTFWFHDQVMGIADWSQVRHCLIHKNICAFDAHKDSSYMDRFFLSKNLKDGCCHKPQVCSKNFLTAHDCDVWKNKTDTMCYYCSSCAEGFVSQLAVLWKRLFPGIVALLVILIVIFIFGCRAFRQNKAGNYHKVYHTVRP